MQRNVSGFAANKLLMMHTLHIAGKDDLQVPHEPAGVCQVDLHQAPQMPKCFSVGNIRLCQARLLSEYPVCLVAVLGSQSLPELDLPAKVSQAVKSASSSISPKHGTGTSWTSVSWPIARERSLKAANPSLRFLGFPIPEDPLPFSFLAW